MYNIGNRQDNVIGSQRLEAEQKFDVASVDGNSISSASARLPALDSKGGNGHSCERETPQRSRSRLLCAENEKGGTRWLRKM